MPRISSNAAQARVIPAPPGSRLISPLPTPDVVPSARPAPPAARPPTLARPQPSPSLPARYQFLAVSQTNGQLSVGKCGFTFTGKFPVAGKAGYCRYQGVTAAHCFPTKPGTQALAPTFSHLMLQTEGGKLIGYGDPSDRPKDLEILFGPRYRSRNGGRAAPPSDDDFARIAYTGACAWIPEKDIAKLAPRATSASCGLAAANVRLFTGGEPARLVSVARAANSTLSSRQCLMRRAPAEKRSPQSGDSGNGIFDNQGRLAGLVSSGYTSNPSAKEHDGFSYSAGLVDFLTRGDVRTVPTSFQAEAF